MMQTVEGQILQAITGLFMMGIVSGIGYLVPKTKQWMNAHTSAKTTLAANSAIDGLSKIAEATVHKLNQTIVTETKQHGVWNPQLAQQIKSDAVQSVMAQAGNLVALAEGSVGNVQDLVDTLVEQAVAKNRISVAGQASSTSEGG
jgi:hypothetical protein